MSQISKNTPDAPDAQSAQAALDIDKLSHDFNKTVRRSQAAIFWERLWPKTVPALSVGGAFLTASWLGVWSAMPPQGRIAGVLLFAAATLAAPLLVKTGSLRVSRKEAIDRIDDHTGHARKLARALDDRLGPDEPGHIKELWNIHQQKRWQEAAGTFKTVKPHPGMAQKDPYNIRYVVLAATLISGAIANDQALNRIEQAFDWTAPPEPAPEAAPLDVRAWVMPPEKIERDPTFLTGDRAETHENGKKIDIHQGSTLKIVVIGQEGHIEINGVPVQLTSVLPAGTNGDTKDHYEYEAVLEPGTAHVQIENGPRWVFDINRDLPPTADIDRVETITDDSDGRERLRILCRAEDDHGVTDGGVIIRRPEHGKDQDAQPLPSANIPPLPIPGPNICRP